MAEQGLMLKIGADVVEVTKSLNQVEQEIKQLNQEIKKLSGQSLVDANKRLDQLTQTATALKNVGRTGFDQFGQQINKIGASALGAAPALNSLSQVARDLPFGFIAIQNNLPIVVDQFSALTRASGGIGAALKGLGASLLGPAGLAFGFGAVTAGVTALIQKYGSLSAAFDAIIGGITPLTEAQKKLAEGVGDELAQITLLVSLYPQLEGRREEQDKLLKKLNQSAPTYFKTLSSEKTTVDQLTASYDKYVKSLLGKIFIESQQERLREVAKEYAKELVKLNDAQVKGAQQRDREKNKLQNEVKLIENLGKAQQNLRGDIAVGVRIAPVQETFDGALENLLSNFRKQADAILSGTQTIVDKLDFGSQFEDETKKIKEAAKKNPISIPIEFQTVDLDKNNTALEKALEAARKQTIANTKFEVPLQITVPQQAFEALRKFGESESFKLLQDRATQLTTQFNDFLAPAIDTVFGALANGQSIPKALAQSFKALLVQITATIAKALILSAILEATGLGGVTKAANAVGKGLAAALNFGGVAAPSFGGISGGGLGLQGQVVFTQRGSDLVGVLNSANGQIRRVG